MDDQNETVVLWDKGTHTDTNEPGRKIIVTAAILLNGFRHAAQLKAGRIVRDHRRAVFLSRHGDFGSQLRYVDIDRIVLLSCMVEKSTNLHLRPLSIILDPS